MAIEKLPLLKHPEVTAEEDRLKEALEMERLVFDYKVRQEEALSIFDEVKDYLTYNNILSSEVYRNLPEELQKTIKKHAGQADESDSGRRYPHSVLFEDFVKLWKGDLKQKERFFKLIAQSIRDTEKEKVIETTAPEHRKDKEKINKRINLRVFGKTAKIAYGLQYKFNPLMEELASFSDEEIKKITNYTQTQIEPVKGALREIKEIREGIQAVKSAKSVEAARKPEEIAKIYKTNAEDVKEFNSLLEGVFEDVLGENFKLGVEETYERVGNIVNRDFMSAYVNYRREMKNMQRLLQEGKIVETGYIKDIIEKAMPALTKNPPIIVYFHGDFGTGKTALAVHISRTRFGKEPIIVSGSKYLDPDRFTEEFRIQKLGSVDFLNQITKEMGKKEEIEENSPLEEIVGALAGKKADLREKIIENKLLENYTHSLGEEKFNKEDFENYVKEHKDKISEGELEDIDKQLDILFSNNVQGRYILGAMYQCMKEGRPLIIDEANAISPDVLIAFNDLLTKKIGEIIKVRSEEKEIRVKEGYCIIWTGNTGERYKKARFNDMDPASYSRIMPIQMRYLPQSREVNNMQQLMERLELGELSEKTFLDEKGMMQFVKESKEKAGSDQIFQVLLLKLLNKRLGAELLVKNDDRYSVFKNLYRLSVGARIIMDMFEGRAENLPRFSNLERIIGSSEPTVLMKKLKISNLTMRDLIDNIVGGYLDEGQSMDIEYYTFKFVDKYNKNPEEQAILYAVLQKVGMFPPSEGWPDYQQIQANDQKEALKKFQDMISFNPVNTVEKYKKIERNGDYISLLNTNGEYEYDYISSLETLQLLFGYLPPRKKEDYERILKRQKEDSNEKEVDVRKREMLNSIRENREALSAALFETASDAQDFFEEILKLKLSDGEFIENSSEEDFLIETDKFNEMLLGVIFRAGKISEEDLKSAQAMSPEAKSEFIRSLLNKSR